MNWPWFLNPLDARSSDICAGSIAVILALSCGFAEIFAAIEFTIGACAVAPEVAFVVLAAVPEVVVVVLVAVPEAGVVILGGVVLVEVVDVVGAPDGGLVTCGCGAAGWPCCGSASADAPTRHIAAATPTIVRAKGIPHPRTANEASEVPTQMGMKMPEKLKLRLGASDETVCVLPVFEDGYNSDGWTSATIASSRSARRGPRLLEHDRSRAHR